MIPQPQEWIREWFYVDAKDKHGEWKVAIILAISKTQIKLRFDGYSSRHDEVFPLQTQRIKPFRSITRGYTGPTKFTPLREHWMLSLSELQSRLQKFEQFTKTISERSAFQLNQFLRGQNMFFVGQLMTIQFGSFEQISSAYEYLRLNIIFLTQYLQQMIERQTSVWFSYHLQSNTISNNNQVLVDSKIAYSQCYYELFETLCTIASAKAVIFLKPNEKFFKQLYTDIYKESPLPSQDVSFQQLITKQMVQSQFLLTLQKLISKFFDEAFAGIKQLPYQFILSTLNLLINLDRFPFSKQLKKKNFLNLSFVVKQYMSTLQINDVKLHERTIEDILDLTRRLCSRFNTIDKQPIYKQTELNKLKLWTMMIQSDVLQKKLRGLIKIKEFYECLLQRNSNPLENGSVILTKSQFKNWLINSNLIRIVFEQNEHTEVIRKGCDLFLLFYCSNEKIITINELVFIWSTLFNKHEAIKKIVFQFWQQLTEEVCKQNDEQKFVRVLIEYDEKIDQKQDWEMQVLFNFIKTFQKLDIQFEQFNQLIKITYRKTIRNQKFIPQLARRISLLQKNSQVLKNIIDQSLESIQSRNQHVFHLKLLARVFSQLRTQNFYIPTNLIPILIEELQVFLSSNQHNQKLIWSIFQIFNQIMSIREAEPIQLEPETQECIDRQNKRENKISLLHVEKLWEMFGKVANFNIKKIFYTWLVHKSFNSIYNFYMYTINTRFSYEFRNEIFFKFLCDSNKFEFNKIDLNEFIVFRQFFIYINVKRGSIDLHELELDETNIQKKIIRVKKNHLQGLSQLWQIFKHCPQNEDLIKNVCGFLKDLYLRTSISMPKQQKQQRVNELMETLRDVIGLRNNSHTQQTADNKTQIRNYKDETLIRRALILISKLLSDIKDIIQIPKQFQRLPKSEKVSINTFININQQQSFQIYTEQPFISVKEKMARKWKLQREQFIVYNRNRQVIRQMYELPFYLHAFEDKNFRIVSISNPISKFIIKFIHEKMHRDIIQLLNWQEMAQSAFKVLEMLEIHDRERLYSQLQGNICSCEQIQSNKQRVFLHIYFLRIISEMLNNEKVQWDEKLLRKLVSHLNLSIKQNLEVNYLDRLVENLTGIRKKLKQDIKNNQFLSSKIKQQQQKMQLKMTNNQYDQQQEQQSQSIIKNLQQRMQRVTPLANHAANILPILLSISECVTLLVNLTRYINKNFHNMQIGPNNTCLESRLFNLTLNFYCNSFVSSKALFNQFIKDPDFKTLMVEIFINCEFLTVKKAIEKKIIFLIKEGFYDLQTEKQFSFFFVNQLYCQIHQKSFTTKLKIEYTGLFNLFRIILQSISQQAFEYIVLAQLPFEISLRRENQNINVSPYDGNSNKASGNIQNQGQAVFESKKKMNLPIYLIETFKEQYDSPMETNYLLNGQLQLLIGLIKRQRNIVTSQLIEYLLYQCLIYLPGTTRGIDVKCLAKENVVLVIDILQLIMFQNYQTTDPISKQSFFSINFTSHAEQILMNLQQFHTLQFYRCSRQWNIDYEEISSTKNQFIGLQNPGCICYINSLLQQLFMIQEFRQALIAIDTQKLSQNLSLPNSPQNQQNFKNNNAIPNPQQNVTINSPQLIPKLKLLFLHLLFSQKSSIDPRFFTESLKTTTDRPLVKIFEQMDIDEFSMILFDKIENHLHHLGQKNFIRDLFGGTYSNEILSLECKHSSQRQEQFLSISLDVKKHINESFMSLVKGQILEGQNAYFCQQCDRKVKAMKRLSIKRLPPHLIISLRRFEFDYEIDQKIKINKYCQFPMQLDLQNYSQQKLNEGVRNNSKGSAKTSIQETNKSSEQLLEIRQGDQNKSSETNEKEKQHQQKDNYFSYKLKGVVVHSGSADSGHYYSFIENKDGRWFQFNDDKVTQFDPTCLEEQAFGARDGQYIKIKNAYLLFYERVQQQGEDQSDNLSKQKLTNQMVSEEVVSYTNRKQPKQAIYDRQVSEPLLQNPNKSSFESVHKSNSFTPYNMPQKILNPMNIAIIQQIIIENKRIRQFHLFFSQEYLQFIANNVQSFLVILNKHTHIDAFLKQILKQMAKQVRFRDLQNIGVLIKSKKYFDDCLRDRSLMRAMFRYLVGFTFCMQLRQNNHFMSVWLLRSINVLFFEHEVSQLRIQFMEMFLQSAIQQQFIDEFLIQCSKQKVRWLTHFFVQTVQKYLQEEKVEPQKKDYIVKRLFKLIMKNVIFSNTNLSELILIMRRLLSFFKHSNQNQKLTELIFWLVKRNFPRKIIQNLLLVPMEKETQQKMSNLIDQDYLSLFQHFQPQINQQNRESLFGAYREKTKTFAKPNQKQSFTLLYQIWLETKNIKLILQTEFQYLKQVNINEEIRKMLESNNEQEEKGNWENFEKQSEQQSQKNLNNTGEPAEPSVSSSRTESFSNGSQYYTVTNPNPMNQNLPSQYVQKAENLEKNELVNEPIQIQNQLDVQKNELEQVIDHEKQAIISKYLEINYTLHQLYMIIEALKSQRLIKLIAEMKDTKSAVALASFICVFCHDSFNYTSLALKAIQSGLKDYQSSKYRPIFICIQKLLQIEDKLSQKRRMQILKVLRAVLRHNEKYFNQCDFTQQWMLRWATKFDFFRKMLKQNPVIIQEIINWINNKRFPGQQTLKKHRLPNCDRLPFKHHGILVSSQRKDYQNQTVYKFQSFEKIRLGQFATSRKYRDLNSPGQEYRQGDTVECFYERSSWVEGKVQASYFGIICVGFYKGKQRFQKAFIMEDDEKIRLNKSSHSIEDQKMEIQK